ncbi:DUF2635 domain-containing protein [Duganella dendranthematis]|uniref:DUF2635 domain-containing protein n=1 Tax=Duganella dendranthematis TaxID=2728021 RepID=A0ABX6MCF8_9BURK|nr:DUF2635 domain-containing protein [Duganella dendranthematis]QJD91803.1 DUF2635 domain-containing protein [Duganella dendranthematis]
MYVIPAQGLSIRDPDLQDLLPESGRLVPDTDYWLRRVRDKDVFVAEAPAQDEAPEPAPTVTEGSEQ